MRRRPGAGPTPRPAAGRPAPRVRGHAPTDIGAARAAGLPSGVCWILTPRSHSHEGPTRPDRCPAHRPRLPPVPGRGDLPDLRPPQPDGVPAPRPPGLCAVLRPGRAAEPVPAGRSPVARVGAGDEP